MYNCIASLKIASEALPFFKLSKALVQKVSPTPPEKSPINPVVSTGGATTGAGVIGNGFSSTVLRYVPIGEASAKFVALLNSSPVVSLN